MNISRASWAAGGIALMLILASLQFLPSRIILLRCMT